MIYTIDAGDLGEIEVDVEYDYTPGTPARLYGPPENCYPEEPEEIEINRVLIFGLDDLKERIGDFLSESDDFREKVCERESQNVWEEA